MVKAYLRYRLKGTLGIITSGPVVCVPGNRSDVVVVSAALENIALWNWRQGTLLGTLSDPGNKAEVTKLAVNPADPRCIAAGYSDGKIRIWNCKEGSCLMTLNAHKGEISALRFNRSGTLLASGAKDTDVVVWDIVAERGLYRLKGHSGMVTDCVFLEKTQTLLTSSKDTLVKVWDLETQHCRQTIVGHRHEVWCLETNLEETRLFTGAADHYLRVYDLTPLSDKPSEGDTTGAAAMAVDSTAKSGEVVFLGELVRQAKDRAIQLLMHPHGTLLACQAADKSLEFFRLHRPDEVAKKRKRRLKRLKEKKRKREDHNDESHTQQHSHDTAAHADGPANDQTPAHVQDELSSAGVVRASHKAKGAAFFPPRGSHVAISLANNTIEVYAVPTGDGFAAATTGPLASVALDGHRSDIRSLTLSGDDTTLLSTSHNMAKLWSLRTGHCLRTLEAGYGLSAAFVPGGRHVVIGTKAGDLELYELASGALLQRIRGHDGAVWAVAVSPSQTGLVTGGADKRLKWWDFALVADPEYSHSAKRLALEERGQLDVGDDVLCVAASRDGKFVACGLLDATIKVYYADTRKFFVALYGHKLPVLSIDISDDSMLLASGSADKNVKIWGMDFGDCHKSLFAHDDSVMCVRFVPRTHYLFTAGKDKRIKYWDADKFVLIHALEAHTAEVWAVAVAADGSTVVSAGHDRSIRVWEQSDEPLFLEEEREKELDELFLSNIEKDAPMPGRGPHEVALVDSEPAAKRSMETVQASEWLVDAMELAAAEQAAFAEYEAARAEAPDFSSVKPPAASPLLLGRTPSDHVLYTLRRIPPSALDDALMLLPFHAVQLLFSFLSEWLDRGCHVQLCCHCLFFLLRVHHSQIAANHSLLELLTELGSRARKKLQEQKDLVGFNKAAMAFLRTTIERNTNTAFFDVLEKLSESKKAKRARLV